MNFSNPVLSKKVDKYQPVYYAGASGDFNPIHIDPEVGKEAGFGGIILHGLCSLAFIAEAAVKITGDPSRLKKIKCRFSRPVRPGDKLEITAIKEAGILSFSMTNQAGSVIIKNALVEII